MTQPAATASMTENDNAQSKQGLSKSQKKRMKRKAAAEKAKAAEQAGEAESGLAASNAPPPAGGRSNDQLNPHQKMKSDLCSKGYTGDEVDAAIEEMWNLGLPYDEYDAVLGHLHAKKAGVTDIVGGTQPAPTQVVSSMAPTAASKPPAPSPVKKDSGGEADTASIGTVPTSYSTDEASPASTASHRGENGGASRPPPTSSSAAPAASSSKPAAAAALTNGNAPPAKPDKEQTAARQQRKRATPSVDLVTRLEVTARFGSVHDAVYALAEWATKTAKPNELNLLCTESQILPTLVRRSVLECETQAEFHGVLSPLLCLFGLLLRPQPPKATSEHVRAILNAARKAVTLCPAEMAIGEAAVAAGDNGEAEAQDRKTELLRESIAEEVATALTTLTYTNMVCNGDSSAAMNKLGKEAAAAAGPTNGKKNGSSSNSRVDLSNLLSRRDKQRSAAEKSGVVAMLAIRSSGKGGDNGANGDLLGGETGLEHSKLFDESTGEVGKFFAENRTALDEAEKRLASVQSKNMSERAEVEAELKLCAAKKEEIATKREELLRQLKQLDDEDSSLESMTKRLEARMEKTASNFTSEEKEMHNQLEEKKGVEKVAHACKNLEGTFTMFQSTLFDMDAGADGKTEKNIDTFFSVMRNYFQTEAECVDFLRGRVYALRSKVQALELEIVQCRNLGMTTNVSQMSHSLMDKTKHVAEDVAAIRSLEEESQQMLDVLVTRLNELSSSGQPLSNAHKAIVAEIAQQRLPKIGLESEKLSNFFTVSQPSPVKPAPAAAVLPQAPPQSVPMVVPDVTLNPPVSATPSYGAVGSSAPVAAPPAAALPAIGMPPASAPSVGTIRPPAPAAPMMMAPIRAAPMPKLSWAAVGRAAAPTGGAAGKKSFLDIQKEEMANN